MSGRPGGGFADLQIGCLLLKGPRNTNRSVAMGHESKEGNPFLEGISPKNELPELTSNGGRGSLDDPSGEPEAHCPSEPLPTVHSWSSSKKATIGYLKCARGSKLRPAYWCIVDRLKKEPNC